MRVDALCGDYLYNERARCVRVRYHTWQPAYNGMRRSLLTLTTSADGVTKGVCLMFGFLFTCPARDGVAHSSEPASGEAAAHLSATTSCDAR